MDLDDEELEATRELYNKKREIKEGEYVRTDNGIIGKYVKFRGNQDTIETNNKWIGFDIENDIVKHSPNIIDLIKEGDYVNGEEVDKIKNEGIYNDGEKYIKTVFNDVYRNATIKSIVTKEQYKSVEYEI